jgi:hypothetical protein
MAPMMSPAPKVIQIGTVCGRNPSELPMDNYDLPLELLSPQIEHLIPCDSFTRDEVVTRRGIHHLVADRSFSNRQFRVTRG